MSLPHSKSGLSTLELTHDGYPKQITFDAEHPNKYNATITYALGFLTAEPIAQGRSLDWDDFVQQDPDLLQRPHKQLADLYPNGAMRTERAGRSFTFPRSNRRHRGFSRDDELSQRSVS